MVPFATLNLDSQIKTENKGFFSAFHAENPDVSVWKRSCCVWIQTSAGFSLRDVLALEK